MFARHETPQTWRQTILTALKWGAPLVNAILETAVAAMAVRDMNEDEERDAHSVMAISMLSGVSLFAFAQAMALSGRETVKNINETIEIVKRLASYHERYDFLLMNKCPENANNLRNTFVLTQSPPALFQFDAAQQKNIVFYSVPLKNILNELNLYVYLTYPLNAQHSKSLKAKLTQQQLVALNTRILAAGFPAITKTFPDDWPTLNYCREMLAALLASLTIFIATGLDFFGAYYFVNHIPKDYNFSQEIQEKIWQYFSVFIGICVAIVTIFTEGIESYKEIRHFLAHKKTQYSHRYISLLARLGYFFVLTGSAEIIIEAYASVKDSDLFSVTSDTLQYTLLGLSSQKGFSDSCFSGKKLIQAISTVLENIYERLIARQLPKLTECIAFLLSAGSSILVAYPQRSLTTNLLTTPETSLPFSLHASVISMLSWGVTWRDGIVQTDTLYEHFLALTQKFSCTRKYTVPDDEEEAFSYRELRGEEENKNKRIIIPPDPPSPKIEMFIEPPPSHKKIFTDKNRYTYFKLPTLNILKTPTPSSQNNKLLPPQHNFPFILQS